MKITNNYNLPEPLYKALQELSYISDDFNSISVSDFISPPRIWYLKKIYKDQIEEDASSRFWALMGTAVHYVLSKEEVKGLQEEKLELQIDDFTIRGRIDYLTTEGTLIDYKFTKTDSLKYEKKEWIEQLNMYAYMLRIQGFDIKRLEIWMILRDHNENMVGEEGYPIIPFVKRDIPLWSFKEQENYVNVRIPLFKEVIKNVDNVKCSDEEMWKRVKKNGVEYIRCNRYCPVKKFCRYNLYNK